MFAQRTQSGAFTLPVPLKYALVNAIFVCGLLPTSSAKQVAHDSQYTTKRNALKVLDMWDVTVQEFFDLTAITQKIARRIQGAVDKTLLE